MYTETGISSRREAAAVFFLSLVRGNRNTRTELATSQAEIGQAKPATLIPAHVYYHSQSVPGTRQIARHDPPVPGGEIAAVVRTPRIRSSPRHASNSAVAPQLPILAYSSSTSPLNQTSLSKAMDEAFKDISSRDIAKEAGQAAQEDDVFINGRASPSQPPLIGIKREPSSPTVPLRHESGASTMRRESNQAFQSSLPQEARRNRFAWTRFTPSREQPPDRVRRRSHYLRAPPDLGVTRSAGEDIGPSSPLAIPIAAAAAAQNSASSLSEEEDTASATTEDSADEDTGPKRQRQQHDLHSLLLRAQATETALMEE